MSKHTLKVVGTAVILDNRVYPACSVILDRENKLQRLTLYPTVPIALPNQTINLVNVEGYATADLAYEAIYKALNPPASSGGGSSEPITSGDITDATATGKSLMTAASGPDARTAIGAGTSNVAVTNESPQDSTAAPVAGVSAEAARADHSHKLPTPGDIGAAATNHTHVGSAVKLTGFVVGASADVVATDDVNQAFGKVEARLVELNNRLAALETP